MHADELKWDHIKGTFKLLFDLNAFFGMNGEKSPILMDKLLGILRWRVWPLTTPRSENTDL